MKQLFKLVTIIFGYGFVLNQYTVLYLESTFQKREICWLLIKNSLDLFCIKLWKTYCIYTDWGAWYDDEACESDWIKTLSTFTISEKYNGKSQPSSILTIELNVLMTNIHPCRQKEECHLFHVYNWIQFFFFVSICIMIQ